MNNPIILYIMITSFITTNSFSQKTIGSIDRIEKEINSLIDKNTKIEVLADGFDWSEGPVWSNELNGLLFSDVPQNKIYFWNEKDGVTEFISPSGYTGVSITSGREIGSNGLTFDSNGNLLLAQHGDRRVSMLTSKLEKNSNPKYKSIVDSYNGKRFNSPNDLVVSKSGDVYFTDPPYGLKKQDNDPLKDLDFNGVYKYSNGKIYLISKELTRPNGLAISNDESLLYVANSDPRKAVWYVFDISNTLEELIEPSPLVIFKDVTHLVGKKRGLPDGMKIHSSGNIFATGPGGVLIFSPSGKHLGTIQTEVSTSNCAFDSDENYLYMTSDNYLTRIKLINND